MEGGTLPDGPGNWFAGVDTGMSDTPLLTDAQLDLCAEALVLVLEATKGKYFYEEVLLKRWMLGSGGRTGNCELCVDNHDDGWVDMDEGFRDVFDGVVDEPPAHPHCDCYIEYKDTRRRVYV